MDDKFHLFPPQASQLAPQYDYLLLFLVLVGVFFSALICFFVIFFAIKYRRRTADERPPHIHTNYALELAWTIIPIAITMVMFVWGAKLFLKGQYPPKDAMQIDIIGKRWMWKVQHKEGRKEINALHVPIGKPIVLNMISQDVIHDFAIPAFRLKEDVRPGWYSKEWFIATKPGTYHLFCDQYCGTGHAEMIGTVTVMPQKDYQEWLAGAPADDQPRFAGEKIYNTYGCVACHGAWAPTLAGLYGRPVTVFDQFNHKMTVTADDAYIRESILEPQVKIVEGYNAQNSLMPSFKGQLSEEQLLSLVAYIKSLSGAADTGPYDPRLETGPSTQPTRFVPTIHDPPFANYRANQ